MDDSCAVCAEPLQWVAYGPCGHREVCSTCVVRLRFICEDRHCCLCKSDSRIIFITKALGDYTRMINDFTIFPADTREGQVGTYWYHEGTQAYFDDVDQYKMVKAMCKLSCSACDKRNEWNEGVRGKGDYLNVELLKSHLAQRHRLSMCSLCLEGRKVFICEQKLYTKAQLDQHIKTGDSEVDGSETERGGFMGHPICQFCEMPYYGENELYSHMQTGHYMCHICQKQHPGKYEYYKNYDDLEIHFRQAHFLCEDGDCLEKKFIVFTNESEMKRHNALEHGGKMSRAQRSAALQIPVSFQYRQPTHQDRRRGRRSNPDSTTDQFSQESRDTPGMSDPPSFGATLPIARVINSHRETETRSFGSAGSFELLTVLEGESSSVHPHDIRPSSRTSAPLEASSFPPLPAAPSKSKKKNKNVVGGLSGNAPVSRLHHQNNRNSSQVWSTLHGPPKSLVQSFPQLRPVLNSGLLSSSSSSSSSGTHQIRSTPRNTNSSSSSSSSNSRAISVVQNKSHEASASSSRKLPNLLGKGGSFDDPVLAARTGKPATGSQVLQKSEEVKAANKSLVERVRLALAYDENSYASFKEISSQFRHGVISTEEYLAWVCQFGLSHLLLELAKLCPDLDKQRELIETYKFNTGNFILNDNDSGNGSSRAKNQRSSTKGKEKCEDNEGALVDSIVSGIKGLKSNGSCILDRADGLLSNAHQSAKGKAKAVAEENGRDLGSQATDRQGLSKSSGTSGGGNKPPPKVSKFLKNRLGDAAAASLRSELNDEDKDPPEVLPVSGAWQNGGGRKIVAMTQKDRRRR